MLIDQVKKRMFLAMKAQNSTEKEILRTAIGEVTRTGDEATDERVLQVMRKLVKANQETLAHAGAEEQEKLRAEIDILNAFLPQALSVDQITEALANVSDAIRAAAASGPAMGIAMRHLRDAGATVESRDVSAAVARLRAD